jgi:antibiotic biosynthesis monooxygenase (ABM) superfamily enzyme
MIEVVPTNEPEWKQKYMAKYSVYVTSLSFLFFFSVVFLPFPETNDQYVNLILGFLMGTAVSQFINYYFGASVPKDKSVTKE